MVLALATAVRVVDRVHDGTADGRAHVHVTLTAGLADDDVGVIGVADLTDGGAAGNEDAAHLGGRHTDDSVLALLTHQLAGVTGRTGDSSALARLELDGVDERTDGDVGEGQSVARLDVGVRTGHDGLTDLEALGGQDVALLTVSVVQQSDASGTVRIVLDRGNLGGNAVLVALEVDHAVTTLHAAALVAGGDAAVVVTTGLLGQGLEKRLLGLGAGDLGEIGDRLPTPTSGGRLKVLYSHYNPFQ